MTGSLGRCLRVLLLLAVAACGGGAKETALPAGARVLALGDSLTAPHGVQPQEAWPALLGQKTGWTVINGGISGNTSAQALERLPALLEEHQPQLVLVSLGGNDMLRKQPQGQTVANLERMIDMSRSKGAKVVLLATPRPSLPLRPGGRRGPCGQRDHRSQSLCSGGKLYRVHELRSGPWAIHARGQHLAPHPHIHASHWPLRTWPQG